MQSATSNRSSPVRWLDGRGTAFGLFRRTASFVAGDNHSRELWEIPEAMELSRRLIQMGFQSPVALSAAADGVPALGALELWAMANGRFKDYRAPMSEDLMHVLLQAVTDANHLCAKKFRLPE